jgi:hypothetical protein
MQRCLDQRILNEMLPTCFVNKVYCNKCTLYPALDQDSDKQLHRTSPFRGILAILPSSNRNWRSSNHSLRLYYFHSSSNRHGMFIWIGNTRKSTNWGAPSIRSWYTAYLQYKDLSKLVAFPFHAGVLDLLQNIPGCRHFVGLMGGVPNAYDDLAYAVVEENEKVKDFVRGSAIIPSSSPPFLDIFHCCMLNHSKAIVVWYKGFPLSISWWCRLYVAQCIILIVHWLG